MNILVIHTGGTIGSENTDGVIDLVDKSPVISRFSATDKDYTFTEKSLCSMLSENADDSFYELIINYISSLELDSFDGVIIMHGTDTLPYTASIVSMALRHISVPVAFLSANYVPDDERSNALENLQMALGYFTCGGKGFVVPYKNSNGRRLFHLATRLMEADSVNDSFESIGGVPLAEIVNNYFVSYDDKTGVSNKMLSEAQAKIFTGTLELKNKVLLIKGYPGIDYSVYKFTETNKPAAILHTAYHSGTANSTQLPEFIKNCNNDDIDFYLSPVKRTDSMYETTRQLLSAGAKPLYNMTTASALAKLKLKYNLPGADTDESLYFEKFNGGIK